MYERTRQLSDKKTFGRYMSKSTTESKNALTHKNGN